MSEWAQLPPPRPPSSLHCAILCKGLELQWYLVLIVNSFLNLQWVPKLRSIELLASHLEIDMLTSVSSWEMGTEWQASAKRWNMFFSSKCDEYRVWWVLKMMSTEAWLWILKDACYWLLLMVDCMLDYENEVWVWLQSTYLKHIVFP